MERRINPEHQKYLREKGVQELVSVGPLKFFEAIRIVRHSMENGMSTGEVEEILQRIGFNRDGHMNAAAAYAADTDEWNELIDLVDRSQDAS